MKVQEASEGEHICLFSNREAIDSQIRMSIPRRELRLLPSDVEITCSLLLYGNYIIMIMSREKPHFAFQLENAVFAKNLRAIFQLLWKLTV